MEDEIKDRVMARLAELRLKPSSLEIRAALEAEGFNKTYIYELVAGRKASIPQTKIPKLARVLGVTPDYLNGIADTVPHSGVRIVGICEAGAWREPGEMRIDAPMIAPDSRVSVDRQVAYLVRGNHAENLGISDASIVVVGTGVIPRSGEIIVVERSRTDGTKETTIKKFSGSDVTAEQLKIENFVGVVLSSIKTF
ncbi:MAG: hypothetical protein RL299_230 [Pseudomonadota bacterium]|jgi:SOS-response transcriptional repressor LexA